MARYTGPKNKLSRKIGFDLGLKSSPLKSARRVQIRPGQHGAKGRRKLSEFGIQLKEKQKVKHMYGILEKQLRSVYEEAASRATATGATLIILLERRLDNVVYRLGFAPTRAAARQLVGHGNIRVNDQKMSIPSYRVQMQDVISLTATAANIPYIKDLVTNGNSQVDWLQRQATAGKVVRLPLRADIAEPIEEQLVVEYYSR